MKKDNFKLQIKKYNKAYTEERPVECRKIVIPMSAAAYELFSKALEEEAKKFKEGV